MKPKRKYAFFCGLASIAFIAIFLSSKSSAQSAQVSNKLSVISPSDGALVMPGQTLSIVVEVSGTFQVVGVIGEVPILNSDPKSAHGPRITFSLAIPTKIEPRSYSITAVGREPGGLVVYSSPIHVTVQPTQ